MSALDRLEAASRSAVARVAHVGDGLAASIAAGAWAVAEGFREELERASDAADQALDRYDHVAGTHVARLAFVARKTEATACFRATLATSRALHDELEHALNRVVALVRAATLHDAYHRTKRDRPRAAC